MEWETEERLQTYPLPSLLENLSSKRSFLTPSSDPAPLSGRDPTVKLGGEAIFSSHTSHLPFASVRWIFFLGSLESVGDRRANRPGPWNSGGSRSCHPSHRESLGP